MRLKIPVEDRVSTYPGRVKLTPVAGATNMYDMERADAPIVEGTPMNKALFDSKADAMETNVTVYVSTSGNDANGDGSVDAPFATVQKAVDSIPKVLNGHEVTIDVATGTYNEVVSIVGFSGGKLKVGVSGRSTTIRGVRIVNSSLVEMNIRNIILMNEFKQSPFVAEGGSNVVIGSHLSINGNNNSINGITAIDGSTVTANASTTVGVSFCYGAAATADKCSRISFDTLSGTDNVVGVTAVRGSIISYRTQSMTNMWGNSADSGGLVLTGSNSSELSGATLDF